MTTQASASRPSIKRWHPYLGEWVIIAPVTAARPWSGTVVGKTSEKKPVFDPGCYLCPGVERASGERNPEYTGVHIFTNDFPSLSMSYDESSIVPPDAAARGKCRVVCFSPRHNATLPTMSVDETVGVFEALQREFTELAAIPEIEYIQIFENRGEIIGVSNPHPHGQIYSMDFVPRMPLAMYTNAAAYHAEHGSCLFCRVLADELTAKNRIVCENKHAVAFVPPFARHTFEVHLMPRRHVPFLTDLAGDELTGFAALFYEMQVRYDNLFNMPFPNITIFQHPPVTGTHDPAPYHFRIEFYPPLRSPDKLKYMAGFESGSGNIVNPSLPAESAEALRMTDTVHYLAGT